VNRVRVEWAASCSPPEMMLPDRARLEDSRHYSDSSFWPAGRCFFWPAGGSTLCRVMIEPMAHVAMKMIHRAMSLVSNLATPGSDPKSNPVADLGVPSRNLD
jgi:hypothetical protein